MQWGVRSGASSVSVQEESAMKERIADCLLWAISATARCVEWVLCRGYEATYENLDPSERMSRPPLADRTQGAPHAIASAPVRPKPW